MGSLHPEFAWGTTFCLAPTFWPTWHGRPFWEWVAPASTALEVTEPRKLSHHDKVAVHRERTPKSNPCSINVLALPNCLGLWHGAATSSKADRPESFLPLDFFSWCQDSGPWTVHPHIHSNLIAHEIHHLSLLWIEDTCFEVLRRWTTNVRARLRLTGSPEFAPARRRSWQDGRWPLAHRRAAVALGPIKMSEQPYLGMRCSPHLWKGVEKVA